MKIHAKNMNFIEYPKIQNIRWVFSVQNLCQFCECSFFQLLQIPWQKLIYNPKCQLDIAPPQTKLKVEWIWVSGCRSCSRWPIDSLNMSKSIRVDDLILLEVKFSSIRRRCSKAHQRNRKLSYQKRWCLIVQLPQIR